MNPLYLDLIIGWFGFWALVWDKSDWKNVLFKLLLTAVAIWGLYLVFNPHALKTAFILTFTAVSFTLCFLWKKHALMNLMIKVIWALISGYGLVLIFSNHLIG